MWTHLVEAWLTGVGIFAVPLMLIAVLAGTLALLDRFF